jgi:hypothetical protein
MKKLENEIKEMVEKLNKEFPTSFDERKNLIIRKFQDKNFCDEYGNTLNPNHQSDIDYYVTKWEESLIDKPVTVEFSYSDKSNKFGNANTKLNVIGIYMHMIIMSDTYNSGYKKERKFMKNKVNDLPTFIKWIVAHEYAHLLYPHLGHTNEFFGNITEIFDYLNK